MVVVIAVLVLIIIFLLIMNSKKKNSVASSSEKVLTVDSEKTATDESQEVLLPTPNLPYKKKLLLTKNEWFFYKSLKPIADELGYSVLAKIRLADLVEVNVEDKKDYMKYFNKINKKHIDFVLAKPENLQIQLLIELDDNSHNDKQKSRDEFIDELYKQTGYKLIRVRGSADLKQKITDELGISQTSEQQ